MNPGEPDLCTLTWPFMPRKSGGGGGAPASGSGNGMPVTDELLPEPAGPEAGGTGIMELFRIMHSEIKATPFWVSGSLTELVRSVQ